VSNYFVKGRGFTPRRFSLEMTIKSQFFLEILLCSFVALFAGCNRASVVPVDRPRLSPNVAMQDITFHSPSLGRDTTYRVIIPKRVPNSQRLPAVYLLHGGGGSFREWSNDSDVARFAEQGLVLVMPDGESSYYTNSVDRPKDRFEDYIVKDLVADVEGRFPVDPSRRAIVGNSMGGFGAIKLALKFPAMYQFVGALSPAIDVPSRPFSIKRVSQYRQHAAIFGPWDSPTRHGNDPFILARSIDSNKAPFMFITCGDKEGLLPSNRQFAALLTERQFRFEFHQEHGGHNWNQWNPLLADLFSALQSHTR
jgi:putative tributyrin esterase